MIMQNRLGKATIKNNLLYFTTVLWQNIEGFQSINKTFSAGRCYHTAIQPATKEWFCVVLNWGCLVL